jgi:hypothetical protein
MGTLLLSSAPAASACPQLPEFVSDHPSLIDRYWAVEDEPPVDESTLQAAWRAEEQASTQAMRAWMGSLAAGLTALMALAMVAVALARLSATRRPLALTMLTRRPVPSVVVFSLLSPMVPPLVLMHAERDVMPSPVLLMAAAGAGLALSMLLARRRLAAQLRWAARGALAGHRDGALVLAEVEAKKLVMPPGARGRMPWFVADLAVGHDGEQGRVALSQAAVDEETATLLHRLACGAGGVGARLTVLGSVSRIPADASGADPLCREAPMQARRRCKRASVVRLSARRSSRRCPRASSPIACKSSAPSSAAYCACP